MRLPVKQSQPGRRPSLRDVAERAGTSTAVVSYVINNGPRPVASPTRARVQRAIEDLGYRPDRLARALRVRRTGTIGLVLPDLAIAFFAEIAHAIEQAAVDSAHRLVLAGSRFDATREREQIEMLLDARVDGLVLVPVADPQATLEPLRHAGVPHVVVHRHMGRQAPSVTADDRDAGRQAAIHLVEHGHQVIACLTGPAEAGSPVSHRTAGFRRALALAGRPVDDALVAVCDYDDLDGSAYAQTMELLARRPDITAICATTDEHALGVLRATLDSGRRIATDLALISIDGTRISGMLGPPLTAVAAPFDLIGRHAVSLLVDPADGTAAKSQRLPMRLIRRASCGCEG